jgi:hypothetical protein
VADIRDALAPIEEPAISLFWGLLASQVKGSLLGLRTVEVNISGCVPHLGNFAFLTPTS